MTLLSIACMWRLLEMVGVTWYFDCGNHFRSYAMVRTLGFSVLNEYQLREAGAMPMTATINFMCEKHGKGR
eukprot:9693167-Prorocentrum_lima.AAC.1